MTVSQRTISIGIGALVLIGGGVFIYRDITGTGDSVGGGDETMATTTKPVTVVDLGVTDAGEGYAVEAVPFDPGTGPKLPPMPALNRPLVFPAIFNEESRESIRKSVSSVAAELEKDPKNFNAWLNLAYYRKLIDDLEGARLVWEYLSAIYPSQSISFGNLADYYATAVKNYPKAEELFKKAIANEPTRVGLYRSLYELYRFSYKTNTTAAPDILKQGLSANPGTLDLLLLLGGYYRDLKNGAEAQRYYVDARVAAERMGNGTLVSEIDRILELLQGTE